MDQRLMDQSLAERVAIVETKVIALQDTLDPMAADLRIVRDYVLGEKAERRFTRRIFAGIAGFFAVFGTLFEIFRR
jgi:hypothetical protein